MNVLLPVMYLILLLLLKSHNITDRTFSIFPFKDAPFKVHLCIFTKIQAQNHYKQLHYSGFHGIITL